ncbi:hypothetical protein REJ26_003145 [Providencia stuartii]|uniref:hypothetical protein n=1 Tax=Providencia TaxID=586 RepID=UPI0027FA317C|nr:hypothetical protein [Providencia sp. 2023EL-00965]ELR5300423.1 hypothetical protein [Providencia stuartii]MDW7588057.1 hypothetical protein [Providencia sp. 2023EL-00965]
MFGLSGDYRDKLLQNSTVPEYEPRIRQRAVENPDGHSFSFSFDQQILKTEPTVLSSGDLGYAMLGTKNGKDVIYNIVVRDGKISRKGMISTTNWGQRSRSFGWDLKLEDIPRLD